jgi:RecG-like helicase
MIELSNTLKKTHLQKLVNSGFDSLYDIITHFPRSIKTIQPFTSHFTPQVSDVYLFEGVLEKVEYRNGKKRFLELTFRTPQVLKVYYFSITNYTAKWLVTGAMFQGLITYRKGFWSATQLAKKKPEIDHTSFVLGSADIQPQLQVIYPDRKNMANADFLHIHEKLTPNMYLLDLTGLVPPNDYFPLQLNLEKIHKPDSIEQYSQSYHTWLKFKVFLKLCVYNSYNKSQIAIPGKQIKLDLEYLKQLVADLPFQLTPSQKNSIWDILQDLSN